MYETTKNLGRNTIVLNKQRIGQKNAYECTLQNIVTGARYLGLISYNVLVAIATENHNVIRENFSYSTTTSKQITQWANSKGYNQIKDTDLFNFINI